MATAGEMIASLERRIAASIDSVATVSMSDGRRIQERDLSELRAELEYWRHQYELENRGRDRAGFPMVRAVFKSDG